MRDHQVVSRIQAGQPLPGFATVSGFIDGAESCAEIEMLRMPRNRDQGSCIATIRPNGAPETLRSAEMCVRCKKSKKENQAGSDVAGPDLAVAATRELQASLQWFRPGCKNGCIKSPPFVLENILPIKVEADRRFRPASMVTEKVLSTAVQLPPWPSYVSFQPGERA